MNTKKIRVFFKKNLTTIAIIAFLFFLFCISFGSSLLETWKLYSYKQDLINQIAVKKEESKQLDEDIKQIGSQEYIERIARQYLELYYPNEEIVIPVENNLAKKDNQNQNQAPEQGQTQQVEQEQAIQDQEVPTETESSDESVVQQEEEQATEEIEEQPQETVQEEEQVTTDEE